MAVAVGRPRAGRFSGSGTRALLLPPALLLAVGLGVPIVAVVVEAVSNLGPGGLVAQPLGSSAFRSGVLTTVLLAVLTTAISLVVGTVYALAMAVTRPGVGRVLSIVLLLSFWISLLVRTYGWLLALQPNGALDYLAQQTGTGETLGLFQTLPGLVLPMVHILLPYMVLPIYAAVQAVEPSQLRAARSLGGSSTLVLRSVVLPGLRSGALAGTVLVFILSLGFYVTPAFLGAPSDRVMAIVIGEVFGRQRDLALASAMGVLMLAGVLLLYFAADRVLRISEQWERF